MEITSATVIRTAPTTAFAGMGVLVASHIAFADRLRRVHPELFQRYRRLFFAVPGSIRSAALQAQVYSQITDRPALRLLRQQRIGFLLYVFLVFSAVLAILIFTPHAIL
jgi:hypothetical protein